MPTLPVHQGWAAIHFTTSRQSSCSCFRYSSVEQPVGLAGAPHVDANAGIAVAGEIGMGQVTSRSAVPSRLR